MSGNDSALNARDQEAEAADVRGMVVGGTDDAMGELLQGFRPYLLTVANRKLTADLRAKCGASDVVQETFREAHRDRKSFRGKTARDLRTWLKGILLHNIRDVTKRFRQTKRRAGREVAIGPQTLPCLIDPEPTPRAHASAREDAARIAQAIAGLPDDYRRVIELRNRENRSFIEIGRELGRTPDAARMLWFRAIENLRRELVEPDAT